MTKKLYSLLSLCIMMTFAAKAQLVINEFSQGSGGTKEFVELVVKGTRTCNDSTADIRGWIIDDNNGWYGGSGTGIAAGNMRLANVSNWQAVPYGSIILLYNASDKNVNITLADDPSDANHDYVYVVPVSTTSTYMESNSSSPSSPSSATWTYSGVTYSSGANWGVVGLSNGPGDAVILVKPSKLDSAYHSIGYGNAVGGTGFHTPSISKSVVAGQQNCYLTDAQYNNASSWTIGIAGAAGAGDETPGAANTTSNATWITSMRTSPVPVTSSFSQAICQGQSYIYNGIPRTTTGAYLDTFTTVGGCDSIVTLNLTVTPLPAAPVVTTPVSYCQNTTATQLTATGTNLLWYANASGGTGSSTAPTPVTTAPGSTTYYVSQTASGCESPRAAIIVNVTATPAAPTVTTPITYCENSTATQLTATGTNILWYSGPSGGTGSSTAPIPVTTAAGSTTYYVSQTVSGCESPRAAIVVNVTAAPAAPVVTSPLTYCQNSVAPQLTATGTNLLWYSGPSGGTGSSTAPTPVTTTAGSTTYYVSQTVSGCESPRAAIVVNITATPSTPVVTTPVTYCQNATASQLTAAGTNLLWYANASGGTGSGTAPTPVTTAAGSTTYYVSQTVGGCESPRTAIVVNITVTPSAPVVVTPVAYCQNSMATPLTAAGANLLWYANATGGTGSNTAPTPITTAVGSTTYYVSQTVGCESPRAAIVVNITAQPSAPTVNSPLAYCQNSVAPQLTATGTNLLWYANASGSTGSSTAPVPATTAAGSTTYYVSQTTGGCESPRAAIVVNVTATPAAPTVNSPLAYCQNSVAPQLTATGTNLLWYANASGGTGSSTAPTPVTTAAGSTTYYVSQTVGGCESPRASITVTVNATPATPVVSSPVTYCQGSTATALTAAGANLQWYTVPTGGTASTTAPVPSTAAAGSTTYYVSSLSAAGCESGRAAIIVNVNAKPAPPATANITYCQNQSASPLTATGTNLLWYAAAGGGTGTVTAPTPSTASAGTTIYYVSQTVNGCESNRAALSVTVATSATPPVVTSPVFLCQNSGTVVLTTYVVGANLLWYTSASGGTGSSTAPSVNTATLGTATWYVSATAGSCETARIPLVVNVVGKPAKPVVTNDSLTYCQNSPVQQFAVTGTNLLWYMAASGGTGNPAAPLLTGTVNGTFTWYVTQTVNGCESDRTSATIKIAAQPAPPTVTAVYNYCQFGTAGPLAAAGTNLLWYTTAAGGTGSPATPTVSTQAAGVLHYYVSQTANGCESQRALITVNITARPAPPVVTTPITYCMNAAAVPLTAIGSNLLWYYAATGGTGTAVPPVPSTMYIDTISYWVTQSNNGCESPRSKLEVYIHYKPNGIILASKAAVCQYDTASFLYFGNAYPASLYDWKSPVNATTMLSGAGTQGPVVIRFDSAGTQRIRLQVYDNGCVSDPAFFDVKVKPAPLVQAVVPASVCAGDTMQIALSYSSAGIDIYQWNFDGGKIIYGSGAGPYGIVWKTPGVHHVRLAVQASGCSSLTETDTVTVHALPAATINGVSSSQVCSDDMITFSANDADSGSVYAWTPAKYFKGFTASGAVTSAQITFPGYVTLSITNRWGCTGRDSVYINAQPCCEVYLPDAFTPNNDGRNDYYRIITKGNHKISTFRVVNRWGQLVFETADEKQGWDGSFNGIQQDMGVYYYYLKYQCVDGNYTEKHGELTLIR